MIPFHFAAHFPKFPPQFTPKNPPQIPPLRTNSLKDGVDVERRQRRRLDECRVDAAGKFFPVGGGNDAVAAVDLVGDDNADCFGGAVPLNVLDDLLERRKGLLRPR